jgi:AcrR family transcriptional regulator
MGITERRERERVQRRNSIIDAAERTFLKNGLEAAKMEEIAGEAELSKSALYLHFKGKDELFLGSVLRFLNQFEQIIQDEKDLSPEKTRNGFEELRLNLQTLIRYAADNPHSVQLTMGLMTSQFTVDYQSDDFQHYCAAIERNIERSVAAVCRGQEDGSVRDDIEARLLVRQIWASLMGVLLADTFDLSALMGKDHGSIASNFLELLLDALRPSVKKVF